MLSSCVELTDLCFKDTNSSLIFFVSFPPSGGEQYSPVAGCAAGDCLFYHSFFGYSSLNHLIEIPIICFCERWKFLYRRKWSAADGVCGRSVLINLIYRKVTIWCCERMLISQHRVHCTVEAAIAHNRRYDTIAFQQGRNGKDGSVHQNDITSKRTGTVENILGYVCRGSTGTRELLLSPDVTPDRYKDKSIENQTFRRGNRRATGPVSPPLRTDGYVGQVNDSWSTRKP